MSREEFEIACDERSFGSKEEVLPEIRERIDQCAAEIIDRHPELIGLSVTGSYPSGGYIDENTGEEFFQAKKKWRARAKMSDIDFITEPVVFDFFTAKNGYKVHCVPIVYPGTPIIRWQ